MTQLSRREALKLLGVTSLSLTVPQLSFGMQQILKKAIPSSGQQIGVVGLGTWQTFDVGNDVNSRKPLKEVLKVLVQNGGSLVDSSPMYGSSEKVVGDLVDELDFKSSIFTATKVWTSGKQNGIDQMKKSIDLMRSNPMDLMQIHNLQDWKTHIKTLYDWKEQGLVKHIGITHYLNSSHDTLEKIIKAENIDFVQLNYSINERNAEKSLLDTARDNQVAVLTNRPYDGGNLFRVTKGMTLPAWSSEFDCKSWGQFFLKYLLSHPSVTCVIPGTSKAHHMLDNMGAGLGSLPSLAQREKMVALINSI